jgi:hypothetical protein
MDGGATGRCRGGAQWFRDRPPGRFGTGLGAPPNAEGAAQDIRLDLACVDSGKCYFISLKGVLQEYIGA